MKRRHSIDELFRRGLGSRSEAPPMHLWENIERRRTAGHRRWLLLRRYQGGLVALTVLLAGAGLWALWPAGIDPLGYFPVPVPTEFQATPPELLAEGKRENTTPSASTTLPTVALAAMPTAALASPPVSVQTAEAKKKEVSLPTPAEPSIPATQEEALSPATLQAGATRAVTETLLLPGLHPTADREGPTDIQLFPNDPKCARFNRVYWRTALELAVSPDWNLRTLTARDSEYEGYLRARDETETAVPGFSATVRFSAISNFGLALRGGLHYSRINERFDYRNENEERIIITNVYGPDGQITGTDTLTETGTRHKVTHNQYQLIDIPLIVGYERQFKKIGLSLNGGAYLNLLFRQKGDFLSPDGLEPVNFSTDNDQAYPAFRERLSLSWYGSFGLTYQLNYTTHLLLEPHVRINPQSFTRGPYPLDQRYVTGGVFIGLRKHI